MDYQYDALLVAIGAAFGDVFRDELTDADLFHVTDAGALASAPKKELRLPSTVTLPSALALPDSVTAPALDNLPVAYRPALEALEAELLAAARLYYDKAWAASLCAAYLQFSSARQNIAAYPAFKAALGQVLLPPEKRIDLWGAQNKTLPLELVAEKDAILKGLASDLISNARLERKMYDAVLKEPNPLETLFLTLKNECALSSAVFSAFVRDQLKKRLSLLRAVAYKEMSVLEPVASIQLEEAWSGVMAVLEQTLLDAWTQSTALVAAESLYVKLKKQVLDAMTSYAKETAARCDQIAADFVAALPLLDTKEVKDAPKKRGAETLVASSGGQKTQLMLAIFRPLLATGTSRTFSASLTYSAPVGMTGLNAVVAGLSSQLGVSATLGALLRWYNEWLARA